MNSSALSILNQEVVGNEEGHPQHAVDNVGEPASSSHPQPQQQETNKNEVRPLPWYEAPLSPMNTLALKPPSSSKIKAAATTTPTTATITAAPTQKHEERNGCQQYSVFNRVVDGYELTFEESSGTYCNKQNEAKPEPAKAGQRPPPPPPASALPRPPQSPLAVKQPVAAPSVEATPTIDHHSSRNSTSMFEYTARRSDEYEAMYRSQADEKGTPTDCNDEILGQSTGSPHSTTMAKKASWKHSVDRSDEKTEETTPKHPAVTTARQPQQQESGLLSMLKVPRQPEQNTMHYTKINRARNGRGKLEQDFSSGNYDMPYTYVNRPDTTHQAQEGGPNPLKSCITQRRVSAAATDQFDKSKQAQQQQRGSDAAPSAAASEERRQQADELPRNGSSSNQLIGPSMLRRANDLALSKWKYVAMVAKKVAEKKTQLRESRRQPERRPSLLVSQGLSVLPMERHGSLKSNDSQVFAPEEVSDSEVSVYDDSGERLLVPNLSDLFSECQSDTSRMSTVFEELQSSDDGEIEPLQRQSPSACSHQDSEPSSRQSPERFSTEHAPPPQQSGNGLNGGVFRRNRRNFNTPQQQQQHYAWMQQQQRYRQKMVQHQRQKFFLQQQQQQQQICQPPPPSQSCQPPAAAALSGAYSPTSAATTANTCHNNNMAHSPNINGVPSVSNDVQLIKTVGTTGRPYPQPDIHFGPRLRGGQSRFVDFTAITGIRLEDARVIKSPNWAALEPPRR